MGGSLSQQGCYGIDGVPICRLVDDRIEVPYCTTLSGPIKWHKTGTVTASEKSEQDLGSKVSEKKLTVLTGPVTEAVSAGMLSFDGQIHFYKSPRSGANVVKVSGVEFRRIRSEKVSLSAKKAYVTDDVSKSHICSNLASVVPLVGFAATTGAKIDPKRLGETAVGMLLQTRSSPSPA